MYIYINIWLKIIITFFFKANINALRNSGRSVFLFYTNGSLEKWLTTINFTDIYVQLGHLIIFLNQNFVSGIILKDIDYNYWYCKYQPIFTMFINYYFDNI